jgi:ribonuclease J
MTEKQHDAGSSSRTPRNTTTKTHHQPRTIRTFRDNKRTNTSRSTNSTPSRATTPRASAAGARDNTRGYAPRKHAQGVNHTQHTHRRSTNNSRVRNNTRSGRFPVKAPMHHLPARQPQVVLPPVPENGVRFIPLGGVEEVGKNMVLVETPEDIIISDAGFQFVSDEEVPGIDYVLPNITYLEERKDKIRGLIITHGHLDHIGGVPFMVERLGNPPVYCTEVTGLLIKKRQEEFPHLPELQLNIVSETARVTLGSTSVQFFPVTHSISDSCGISVETKYGNIVISGDLKLEHDDGTPSKREEKVWGTIGKNNNILFYGDSTNAEKSGFSIPEHVVYNTLEDIIRNVSGRLIIGTFASQFERMIHIMNVCEKLNKKVVIEGRSMRNNIEIAKLAKRIKVREETFIQAEQMGEYPANRIVILATGAQGEEFGALMRIAAKKHKSITFNERDTVVLSSSVIPGNELSVQRLKDNLYRYNLRIIHYRASDVHSTGHGNTGELVWIREKVKPRFFIPGYGYHSMLRCHAQAQMDAGFPKENVCIPDNGTIIDFIEGKEMIVRKEKAPNSVMMVDGRSIGQVQDVVIRDRKTLAQDGMFVIIATVNARTGELRKSPDIISRGFVYLRESQELLGEARIVVKKAIHDSTKGMNPIDFEYVRDSITQNVSKFLLQKTDKRPIVIPVVLGL